MLHQLYMFGAGFTPSAVIEINASLNRNENLLATTFLPPPFGRSRAERIDFLRRWAASASNSREDTMKRIAKRIALSAAVASLAMIGAAQAQTTAIATTDLNIRSGPGPEHPIIGNMGANRRATVIGCVEGSFWCQVNFRGIQGWAYSQYMTLNPGNNREVVVIDPPMAPGAVTYRASAYRAPADGYAEPVIGRDIAAARGAYAMAPNAVPAVTPPSAVGAYVTANPVDPVVLDGEVVVGAGLPRTVVLQPIPDYRYQYVYVDEQPVLVDPATRRIVYVFR